MHSMIRGHSRFAAACLRSGSRFTVRQSTVKSLHFCRVACALTASNSFSVASWVSRFCWVHRLPWDVMLFFFSVCFFPFALPHWFCSQTLTRNKEKKPHGLTFVCFFLKLVNRNEEGGGGGGLAWKLGWQLSYLCFFVWTALLFCQAEAAGGFTC